MRKIFKKMKSTLPSEIKDYKSAVVYLTSFLKQSRMDGIDAIEVESKLTEMFSNWSTELRELMNEGITKSNYDLGETYMDAIVAVKLAMRAIRDGIKQYLPLETLYETQDESDIIDLTLDSILKSCNISKPTKEEDE